MQRRLADKEVMMWRILLSISLISPCFSLLAGILPVTPKYEDPTETFYEQVRLGNSKSNDVLVSITVSFITYKNRTILVCC